MSRFGVYAKWSLRLLQEAGYDACLICGRTWELDDLITASQDLGDEFAGEPIIGQPVHDACLGALRAGKAVPTVAEQRAEEERIKEMWDAL